MARDKYTDEKGNLWTLIKGQWIKNFKGSKKTKQRNNKRDFKRGSIKR